VIPGRPAIPPPPTYAPVALDDAAESPHTKGAGPRLTFALICADSRSLGRCANFCHFVQLSGPLDQ